VDKNFNTQREHQPAAVPTRRPSKKDHFLNILFFRSERRLALIINAMWAVEDKVAERRPLQAAAGYLWPSVTQNEEPAQVTAYQSLLKTTKWPRSPLATATQNGEPAEVTAGQATQND